MPKNEVNDPITDQEIAFAHLVLSGAMTDDKAAEAVGLNPGSAAHTKAKPSVRAFILEHRALTQHKLVQKDAGLSRLAVEGLRRGNPGREQVLDRLWEIANLSPEITRSSVTGQVKALGMIIAMENFIPNRLAPSPENKSAPTPTPQIYRSAWLQQQQATTPATANNEPQPNPKAAQQEDALAPQSAEEVHPDPDPSQSTFANPSSPSEAPPAAPNVPAYTFVPDLRVPFSIKKNPFSPRRR